jgi:hypothetical protein
VRFPSAPPKEVMEKIAIYLAIITLVGLIIAYGILYFGYDFR